MTSTVASSSSQVEPSESLERKLAEVRHSVLLNNAGTSLAIATIVCVELLGLAMFLDWWMELPVAWRAFLLVAQLVVAAWLAGKHIIPHLRHRPSDEQLARLVETARPELRSRLIASVQLSRPGALPPGSSTIMVEALLEQTEAAAARVDFGQIVGRQRFNTLALAAACISLIALTAMVSGRPATIALLKRAFLSNVPVPRKTLVEVIGGDKVVGRGDAVLISALARGLVPASGWLEIHRAGGAVQTRPMQPSPDNEALFVSTLTDVHQSLQYRVRLNDGRSEFYSVVVLPRPALARLECRQSFPAYTGLAPLPRQPADLVLLAGSILEIRATATKDLASAKLMLAGLNTELPAKIQGTRDIIASFSVSSTNLSGFSIALRDTDGMNSTDPVLYRIQVIPDRAPALSIKAPARIEELVTRSATAIVGFEATDDFGITALHFRYRSDISNAPAHSISLDLGTNISQHVRHRFEWRVPMMPLGERVEFWLEASDNNDTTGPSLGASEHQFVRIVTEDEKRADLWNRAADSLSLVNDLAADQDKLNQELGTIIRARPTTQD